jgi:3-oxo-5-alpha-steroid 4-dehydrogenase
MTKSSLWCYIPVLISPSYFVAATIAGCIGLLKIYYVSASTICNGSSNRSERQRDKGTTRDGPLEFLANRGKALESKLDQELQLQKKQNYDDNKGNTMTTFVNSIVIRMYVRKSHFRLFYITAVANWIFLQVKVWNYYQIHGGSTTHTLTMTNQQQERQHLLDMSHETIIISIIFYLYGIQVFRRLYESFFVHRSNACSKMHGIAVFLGCIYYICVPTTLLGRYDILVFDCCSSLSTVRPINEDNSGIENLTTTSSSPFVTANFIITIMIAIGFNLTAQYQQYRHHLILAKLRNNAKSDEPDSSYKIPYGGYFEYVCCPHYFFEIIIYLSFGILLQLLQNYDKQYSDFDYNYNIVSDIMSFSTTPIGTTEDDYNKIGANTTTTSTSVIIYMYAALYRYRFSWVVSFVCINLLYEARQQHVWYSNHFRSSYTKLNRKLVIPGIL